MIELDVIGVRVDLPSNVPMLLLKETNGSRYLPVWIGATEATSIVNVLEGLEPPRPLTHDLMAAILTSLGHTDITGCITDVSGGVFYAHLVINGQSITARPSDVVALALRMGFALTCTEGLMDQVGVEASQPESDEVEKFREFLESINPEDFE